MTEKKTSVEATVKNIRQKGINDVVSGIRTKLRPLPAGGRLPTPGPAFVGSSFGTQERSNFGTHTVQGGEVVSRIANRYETTVNAFAQESLWLLNRQGRILKGVDYIRPGDRLGFLVSTVRTNFNTTVYPNSADLSPVFIIAVLLHQ